MSNTSEFKNENILVHVEQEPDCKVTFKITITPETVNDLFKKALKVVNKEISIPGFRKGHAPTELILKHYSKHVEREWKDILFQESFYEAINLSRITPYTRESILDSKIEKLAQNEPAVLSVTFESHPNIPTINAEDLQLTPIEAEPVTNERIQQILEDIRYQFADWTDVKDRAVQEGDFIELDIQNLDKPGTFLCEKTVVEATKEKIGSWLLKLVVGMNIGESKDGLSQQEEGENNPKFNPTNCRVTVTSISTSTLPEVNDELAKKVRAESVEDLMKKIEHDLKRYSEREATQKMRSNLREQILNKYSFDVPSSLTKSAVRYNLKNYVESLNKEEFAEGELAKKVDEIEQEIKDSISSSYRWQFLTLKAAEDNHISVDAAEVNNEMMRRMYMNMMKGAEEPEDLSSEDMQAKIRFELTQDKIADLLLEKIAAAKSSK